MSTTDDHRPDQDQTQRTRLRSRKAWCTAGSYVLVAGAAVAITLAATHESAKRENCIAYLRGRLAEADTDLWELIGDLLDRIDELEAEL